MNNEKKLPDTLINFYDNYIPKLKFGEYEITLSQSLKAAVSTDDSESTNANTLPDQPQKKPVTQKFLVNGPRFSLPPSDINHVFPHNKSIGVYDTYLPQVVINEKAMPWERNLNLDPIQTNLPWMALLVFSDDELPVPKSDDDDSSNNQKNPTRISNQLLTDVVVSNFQGKPTNGPPSGILGPQLCQLEDNEDPDAIYCKTIDIPVTVFNALAPNLEDAKYLAHTREVSLTNKASVSGTTGFFSAVIANRFAVPPVLVNTNDDSNKKPAVNTNIAHLVSLEGFEEQLNVKDQPNVSGYDSVRMISLYSWTFQVQQEPLEDFGELMNHLISEESINGTDLLLRMPPIPKVPTNLNGNPDDTDFPPTEDTQQQMVKNKIQNGYVALSYEMQSGDQSFAWYRGPCTPVPVTSFLDNQTNPQGNPLIPFSSSDAMIFDPQSGLFDQSYAIAFQTGRSIALANRPFATSLINWRRTSFGLVDLILEFMRGPYKQKMITDGLLDNQGNLTATGIADLSQLIHQDVVATVFTDFFASNFFQNLAKKIGKEGGFSTSDTHQPESYLTSNKKNNIVPGDLNDLLQDPLIISLLEHLSGFDNLGVLAEELKPSATSISIQTPGLTEAISSGISLYLISPDGSEKATIVLESDAVLNAKTLNISYTGTTTLPTGSLIQIADANQDALSIVDWLANTALLKSVPFNNLIANPKLLPQESIRFFYLDENWINALLDGALSIALQSSRDVLFTKLMRGILYEKIMNAMALVRLKLLGLPTTENPPEVTKINGFLIRSQNIVNYPGLDVIASAKDTNGQTIPMKPLRQEKLSRDLMIVIYPDIPTEVIFKQPSEGLVFGVETDSDDDGKELYLRYIPGVTGNTDENKGSIIGGQHNSSTIPLSQIQKANRPLNGISYCPALNIAPNSSEKNLTSVLSEALPGNPTLTPASLAVQMVCVPQQMNFEPKLS